MASKRKTGRKHKPTHKNKWRETLRLLSNLATVALPLVKFICFLWDRFHR